MLPPGNSGTTNSRHRIRRTGTYCDHPRVSAPEVAQLLVARVSQVCASADLPPRPPLPHAVPAPAIAPRPQPAAPAPTPRRVATRADRPSPT